MEKENEALQEKLETLEANSQNSNCSMKEMSGAMAEKQSTSSALEKKLVEKQLAHKPVTTPINSRTRSSTRSSSNKKSARPTCTDQ